MTILLIIVIVSVIVGYLCLPTIRKMVLEEYVPRRTQIIATTGMFLAISVGFWALLFMFVVGLVKAG